jgi:hypothetical protein
MAAAAGSFSFASCSPHTHAQRQSSYIISQIGRRGRLEGGRRWASSPSARTTIKVTLLSDQQSAYYLT